MIPEIVFPENNTTAPFLKWVGGKRWLITSYLDLFPTKIDRYIEPFLGSGAVYFGLTQNIAILSDLNEELIETYIALRDDWQLVEKHLRRHARDHTVEHYYKIRSLRPRTCATRAARFIYLNRTCFNGIYRVNKQGQFNVPKGSRDNVILGTDDFSRFSAQLKTAKLIASDFEPIIDNSKNGDFMFIDPPYTVAHHNNGFIKYNEVLFTWNDQIRLRDCLERAARRGVRFLLTNADHKSIRDLYKTNFHIRCIKRSSAIASASSFRKAVTELVIEPK